MYTSGDMEAVVRDITVLCGEGHNIQRKWRDHRSQPVKIFKTISNVVGEWGLTVLSEETLYCLRGA
jgi:hypothetical protein